MHGPILNLLFTNAPEGTLILQASAISIIFTLLEQTVNGALQGLGKIMVPTIALIIGVFLKFILNIILVPIPTIGAAGAALATVACHAVAFFIGFHVLKNSINLNLGFFKFIFKPITATIMMGICSYASYLLLESINIGKMATIISILIAGLIYAISIFILKIFTKEEIFMIPYGQKIYKILEKIGIYKISENADK